MIVRLLSRLPRAAAPLVALLLVAAGCEQGFDLAKVDRSVVRVQHLFIYEGKELLGGHGTGFVLTRDGYVVTSHDVVSVESKLPKGLKSVRIFIPDGSWSKRLTARVVWSSKSMDLAILRVPGLKREPVTLSAAPISSSPLKGDVVYAIGFPGAGDSTGSQAALESTFTSGVVGKVSRGRGQRGGAERLIVQHTANINPGNSGGPLFNQCNQVVAINTFAATSVFKITKGPEGEYVAHGAAVSGVYYSAHISALIEVLNSVPELKGVKYSASTSPCEPPSGIPMEMYIAAGAIGLLALISLLLATMRKRAPREVVKVVETYSQWIRRRSGEHNRKRSGVPTMAPGGPGGGADLPPPELDDGWLFQGQDVKGNPVRLVVGQTELEMASKGTDKGLIFGRSNALASKILSDGSVSRRHARLVLDKDGLSIEDLNSTYGTKVNGAKLAPYTAERVKEGDKLMLGDVKLTLTKK